MAPGLLCCLFSRLWLFMEETRPVLGGCTVGLAQGIPVDLTPGAPWGTPSVATSLGWGLSSGVMASIRHPAGREEMIIPTPPSSIYSPAYF